MPHLGRGNTIEDLLFEFLRSLETKLRKAKFPPIRVGNNSELRWDMDEYLSMRPGLDKFGSDRATAKAIEPEYIRKAASEAVEESYRRERQGALRLLAGALTSWRIVDALADAFIRALGKQPKTVENEAIGSTEDLPFRYFIHATISAGVLPTTVLAKIVEGWQKQIGSGAVIDDCGWLQGSVRSASGKGGSPDGLFLIVRSRSTDLIIAGIGWLGDLGCDQISTPQMLDIEFTGSNSRGDEPELDPTQTH